MLLSETLFPPPRHKGKSRLQKDCGGEEEGRWAPLPFWWTAKYETPKFSFVFFLLGWEWQLSDLWQCVGPRGQKEYVEPSSSVTWTMSVTSEPYRIARREREISILTGNVSSFTFFFGDDCDFTELGAYKMSLAQPQTRGSKTPTFQNRPHHRFFWRGFSPSSSRCCPNEWMKRLWFRFDSNGANRSSAMNSARHRTRTLGPLVTRRNRSLPSFRKKKEEDKHGK